MKLFNYIKELLFPPKCAVCFKILGKRTVFCRDCMPEIPFVDGITCEKCGIPLSADFPSPICARCRKRNFHFDKNTPVLEHSGMGRQAVINMKYNSFPIIKDMAYIISGRVKRENIDFDYVTYIPMTRKDEREKKIHVTYFLSKEIAKLLNKDHKTLIVKQRETKKQKELTENERIINVRGAFAVKDNVKGKKILLVDDVFTTGATMDECAKILKRAGATAVYCTTVSIRDRE